MIIEINHSKSFFVAACVGAMRVAQPQILWIPERMFEDRTSVRRTRVRFPNICSTNGRSIFEQVFGVPLFGHLEHMFEYI